MEWILCPILFIILAKRNMQKDKLHLQQTSIFDKETI